MKRKEDQKICYNCSKIVETKKDHYVLLGTYNRKIHPDENCYFHFKCWVEYFMRKVNDRARIQVQGMQKMAVEVLEHPAIKGLLQQIQGSGALSNMLKTPLSNKDNYVSKRVVINKIHDVRKKQKREKKRKTRKA